MAANEITADEMASMLVVLFITVVVSHMLSLFQMLSIGEMIFFAHSDQAGELLKGRDRCPWRSGGGRFHISGWIFLAHEHCLRTIAWGEGRMPEGQRQ